MDFTREPVIETIITPKEGHKLVVRSSKGYAQEEHFVDAIEVVSFGSSFFFRSLERPKSFMVPVNDYELLEVRETRMVLKNVGTERTIKIAGGKEGKQTKGQKSQKAKTEPSEGESEGETAARVEKKRDRRRTSRRRKSKEESPEPKAEAPEQKSDEQIELAPPKKEISPESLKEFLCPPPKLIAETIHEYKDKDTFKDIFVEVEEEAKPNLEPPHYDESKTEQLFSSSAEENTPAKPEEVSSKPNEVSPESDVTSSIPEEISPEPEPVSTAPQELFPSVEQEAPKVEEEKKEQEQV